MAISQETTPVGQEFWIVAVGCSKTEGGEAEKDKLLSHLNSSPLLCPKRSHDEEPLWQLSVPDGDRSLTFGSFDNLIRLTDDLQKCDSQLDSIVHRLERQFLELDPGAKFMVQFQRTTIPFARYIRNWQWDDAKYPRSRSIVDNMTLLMSVVSKLDEECRNKTAQYNETKTQKSNLAKKDGANLLSKDLMDVLTPDTVRMNGDSDDDFVMTEHLATVVVIIPRGSEAEFLKSYEKMCDHVVPMSAKKFTALDDKDGNSIWRVVMFKSAVEAFKKVSRERRLVPRDFEFSADAYKKLCDQREAVEDLVKKQCERVRGLYSAAWSDAMVAWMHVKAMRVFVESVLRFGMPPSFATFAFMPKPGTQANARKALADILGKQQNSSGPYSAAKLAEAAGEDGDEYFPYVSLSFVPFTVARA